MNRVTFNYAGVAYLFVTPSFSNKGGGGGGGGRDLITRVLCIRICDAQYSSVSVH